MLPILYIITAGMAGYASIYIWRLKRHDAVLYRFCSIRREAMSLVRNEGIYMDKNNYASLRELLFLLNVTIKSYRSHKTVIFNMRRLEKNKEEFQKTTERDNIIENATDERIKALHKEFGIACIKAFLTYTPLIRSEISLWCVAKLIQFGLHSLQSFKEAGNLVHEQSNKLGIPSRV